MGNAYRLLFGKSEVKKPYSSLLSKILNITIYSTITLPDVLYGYTA
jgi:hypothetical protein